MGAAVQQDGVMLQHAMPWLRDDKYIVEEAVRHRVDALDYASSRLKEDEDILVLAHGDRRRMGLPLEILPPLPLAKPKPLVPPEPEVPAGLNFLFQDEHETTVS